MGVEVVHDHDVARPQAGAEDFPHATGDGPWQGRGGPARHYVAAQSGIFAYFINYVTSQAPVAIGDQRAALLASVAFACFLAGRVSGAALLRRLRPDSLLGLYGLLNAGMCLTVIAKLGWASFAAVFGSYFFMSIMYPTIFALGIQGLGARAKRASGYIVMAIMGGAIVPKLMGAVGDRYGMSVAFVVPMVCFLLVPQGVYSDGNAELGLAPLTQLRQAQVRLAVEPTLDRPPMRPRRERR